MTAEVLPTKQKQLIGIGASIAAGCQPCTQSFAAAARESGACDRGVRFAAECGLAARLAATASMQAFADQQMPPLEIDVAFRAERTLLEALIGVAAAMACNSAPLVASSVAAARKLGATDDQVRVAAEMGRITKRGAERSAESALQAQLGSCQDAQDCSDSNPCGCKGEGAVSPAQTGCGCGSKEDPPTAKDSAGGCGCKGTEEPFETVRIPKTSASCGLCEQYAQTQEHKPIVVMSCEGACLRGEISRQAANHLCHIAPEKTARLCLGGAFTKNGGQRGLVRNAKRVVALEGCAIRCASRMMQRHLPNLEPEVYVTDGLCQFDRSLFAADALADDAVVELGRAVASKIAAQLL